MDLFDPSDSLEKQNAKLLRITQSLMRRIEQAPDHSGMAYVQFERAAVLEELVRERTSDLERALDLLHQSNARVARADTEAREARENLSQAIETIDEGFAMFGDDDRLVMFNSRFCQDLPDVRAKLQQGTDFTQYVRLVSESPSLACEIDETPDTWRARRINLHKKDHAVFNIRLPENRWMQVSEHRTDTRGTVVLQTDVTQIMRLERREREKLIEQQTLMLRATLDHLYQGVCIFDNQCCLVGWNQQMENLLQRPLAERFRGMPFSALLTQLDGLFFYPDIVQRDAISKWADTPSGRDPLRFEVLRKDMAVFDVFMQEMPDAGFVISFSDITDERRTSNELRDLNESLERRVAERTTALGDALEAARRANATKDRFVAAAGHDLLQPLSAAKLYTANLEDKLHASSDKAVARKAISALASAEALIEALLDISKLDLGLADFEMAPVALNAVLGALSTEFAPLAREKGINLRFVSCARTVVSDPVYLRRILQNLIANALRYTTGANILVGARHKGNSVRIDVLDQGPGISAENQQLIFQEFKQVARVNDRREGLGLGLAIVERACTMLGHELELWSQEGVGSRFSVLVNTLPGSPSRLAPSQSGTGGNKICASRVVGLVENDPDLAHSITLTIESVGSEVVHAIDAAEALALIDEIGIIPDGFLLDYQLDDGMNGVDLARALRRRYGDIPIQIISADRSEALQGMCQKLDLNFSRKPLARDDILSFVSSLPVGGR